MGAVAGNVLLVKSKKTSDGRVFHSMMGIQVRKSASNRKVVYSLLEASSVGLVTTKNAVAVFLVMACCCAKVKAPTNSLPILVSDGLVF